MSDSKDDARNPAGTEHAGADTPPARDLRPGDDTPPRRLQEAIGHEVRMMRRQRRMTVTGLAAASGLSVGMLSKIENGVTSPSLASLQALGAALGTPVSAFFRRFEEDGRAPVRGEAPAPGPAPDQPD